MHIMANTHERVLFTHTRARAYTLDNEGGRNRLEASNCLPTNIRAHTYTRYCQKKRLRKCQEGRNRQAYGRYAVHAGANDVTLRFLYRRGSEINTMRKLRDFNIQISAKQKRIKSDA